MLLQLCGGASCSGPAQLYRIHDGEWSPIVELPDAFTPLKQLALDGSGQGWLFWDGKAYQLEGDSMQPAASIDAHGVGVGPDGRVWVVAKDGDGASLLVLEP